MTASPPRAPRAAWILAPGAETTTEPPGFEVWGLSPVERLRRALAQAGCAPVGVLAGTEAPGAPAARPEVLVRGDWIADSRLIDALAGADPVLLVADSGEPVAACAAPDQRDAALTALREGRAPAGLRAVRPAALAPAYTAKLRKSEPPFLLPARPERRDEIEAHTFAASYKGATDLVTKWVWPRPARAVTRRLATAHVHPNTVTVASWVLAIAAFALFWHGWFLLGLAIAWAMTFLDTVDGKLARVTLTSTRLGDVLDHGLDLVHPPLWWWAFGVGLGQAAHWSTLVVVGGYFTGRALEGAFLAGFGIETHSWRPIDTLFRTITARRNPNLILLSVGALAGRPDLGLVMVALWTLACLGFHGVRLLQAAARRARGGAIEPWDREALAAPGGSSG
jgi:phosphatidylglycerophosphate synthase